MKKVTNCRVCGSEKLTKYLDLGLMPLSNNLGRSIVDPIHFERYPLEVLFCGRCGLSQLSVVIDPETLFSHYVYRSSISKGYVDHCRAMAIELKEEMGLNENSYHIDIAGNDGALLQQFVEVTGERVLNIDPAENLAAVSMAVGIPVLTKFWSVDTASQLLRSGYGQADLITATNVFAHVDNVKDFIEAAKIMLKPNGRLVLEFPYLVDFIENKEFDTVYFEHLSYFSIYPLVMLCNAHGLKILKVQKQDIHGGTVRVTIGHDGEQHPSVHEFLNLEQAYLSIEPFENFAREVEDNINKFANNIRSLTGTVAAFAASAKGNTLLNAASVIYPTIKYIVDQTPEKIGNYSPGTFIPIISMHDMMRNPPDHLVILSWNFKEEIIGKCRAAGYKGKFIVPVPEFEILE